MNISDLKTLNIVNKSFKTDQEMFEFAQKHGIKIDANSNRKNVAYEILVKALGWGPQIDTSKLTGEQMINLTFKLDPTYRLLPDWVDMLSCLCGAVKYETATELEFVEKFVRLMVGHLHPLLLEALANP